MTSAAEHVHVVVHLHVRAESEVRALAVFGGVIAATRAEPACVRYELFRAVEDPQKFVLVEEWRSQAGLDEHLQQTYVKELFTVLPDVLAAPPAMTMLVARPA
jgi:quinol monooxygenase YgiN